MKFSSGAPFSQQRSTNGIGRTKVIAKDSNKLNKQRIESKNELKQTNNFRGPMRKYKGTIPEPALK